ncbi:PDZ domain-containing protein [bacterium]|nr:PDZ domain-containing protein [bacterium]
MKNRPIRWLAMGIVMGMGGTMGMGFMSPTGLPMLQKVHHTIANFYIRPVDPTALEVGAIKGYLAALQDPYTRYVDATTLSAMQQRVMGDTSGVGLQLMTGSSNVTVARVTPGSSAFKAGIQVGDQLISINQTPVSTMRWGDIMARLRGPIGSTVMVRYQRNGHHRTVQLERMPVDQQVVTTRTVGRIGIMTIPSFESQTIPDECKRALQGLLKSGIKGLVIDLRFNGGGLLSNAVKVSQLFLGDRCVVRIIDRYGASTEEWASSKPLAPTLPLVIVVNGQTASSAEIVAAALQDHKRATIVGQPTYGKSTIQKVLPLANGMGGIIYTNAAYQSPNGRDLSKGGIQVDIPVSKPTASGDPAIQQALAYLGGNGA